MVLGKRAVCCEESARSGQLPLPLCLVLSRSDCVRFGLTSIFSLFFNEPFFDEFRYRVNKCFGLL